MYQKDLTLQNVNKIILTILKPYDNELEVDSYDKEFFRSDF